MTVISRLTAAFAAVLYVVLVVAPLPAEGQGSVAGDRAALVALYNATDGPNWRNSDNWLSNEPLRRWWGVRTDDDGRVEYLSLQLIGLTGEIPAAVGDLAKITELWLGGNDLVGRIPPEIGNLPNLEKLRLFGNELSGTIPRELGNLRSIETLDLSGNNLSGTIPPELGNLRNLRALLLEHNELTGHIPPEIGRAQALEILRFDTNNLTGPIPSELGNLPNLDHLVLHENNLTGTIPHEFRRLAKLEELHLYDNNLTGTIPTWLGSLTNLEWLMLDNNNLTGEIPRELGDLPELDFLRLEYNRLTGTIPLSLERFRRSINPQQGNRDLPIEGTVVDPVDSAADKAVLEAFYNATGGANWNNNANWNTDRPLSEWYGVTVGGDVPRDADNHELRVTGLSLPDNNLTGEIPRQLADLPQLETLVLNDNNLTGAIPEALRRFEDTINPQQGGVNLPVGTPVPALPFVAALLLACGLYVMGRRKMLHRR